MSVTLENISEALKYTAGLIDNTDSSIDLTLNFLENYSYVETVSMSIPDNTTIKADTIDVVNIEKIDVLQDLSESFWNNFFMKKNELLSKPIKFTNSISKINKEASFLTTDYIEKESLISEYKIQANVLSYSNDVVFEEEDYQNKNIVPPLSYIDSIAVKKNEEIEVDLNAWSLFIQFNSSNIYNQNNDILNLEFIDTTSPLKIKNVSVVGQQFNREYLEAEFLKKNYYISAGALIPSDAKTNIATFEDIINSGAIKTNDNVYIEFSQEQELDILIKSFDEFTQSLEFDNIITDNKNYLIQKKNLNAIIMHMIQYYTD